jgi:hypothetical protein
MSSHLIPNPGTGAHQVVMAVYRHGPIHRSKLLELLDAKSQSRRKGICKVLEEKWTVEDDNGFISTTRAVKKHLDDTLHPQDTVSIEPEYEGIAAGPSLIEPMKAKPYIPPKRFVRGDVPDWSRRPDGFSFKTALGTKGVEL